MSALEIDALQKAAAVKSFAEPAELRLLCGNSFATKTDQVSNGSDTQKILLVVDSRFFDYVYLVRFQNLPRSDMMTSEDIQQAISTAFAMRAPSE